MFTWICPKCGREVPPSSDQCPNCAQPERDQPAPVAVAEPPSKPPKPAVRATGRLPGWVLALLSDSTNAERPGAILAHQFDIKEAPVLGIHQGPHDVLQRELAGAQPATILFSLGRLARVAQLHNRRPRRHLRHAVRQSPVLSEVIRVEHHFDVRMAHGVQ